MHILVYPDSYNDSECREAWSDAARASALCVRTQDPRYCAKAAVLVKKKIKGLFEPSPEQKAARDREDALVAKDLAQQRQEYEDFKSRRGEVEQHAKMQADQHAALGLKWYQSNPITTRSRGRDLDLSRAVDRATRAEAQALSPRDLTTGKILKGQKHNVVGLMTKAALSDKIPDLDLDERDTALQRRGAAPRRWTSVRAPRR